MTPAELAAWCVTVTQEEYMNTELPPELAALAALGHVTEPTLLEAVRIAGLDWEAEKASERQARSDLAQAILEAREEYSLSEIAVVLGVSRQRVHQLSGGQDV